MELKKLAYSVNETAEMLNVSRSRMYRFMETGEIFFIQPGGNRMIPAEAIQAFLRGEHYDPNEDRAREAQADTTTWPPTESLLSHPADAKEQLEAAFMDMPGDYGQAGKR
jgi:excisionase family DNA binding protein